MLQKFRERIMGLFGQVILGFIFVTFSLWGVNAYFTGDLQNIVAAVGDAEISLQDFRSTYLRMYQQRRDLFGERFRPELIDEQQLAEQALETLVRQELMAGHARDSGYRVSDAVVRQAIMDIPAFQANGEFSRELYQVRLATQGLSAKGFEFEVREGLQTDQVQDALLSSEFILPHELASMIAIREEKRQFASVSIPAGKFYAETNATEEDILNYYEENTSSFMTQESIDLQYIELTADNVTGEIDITEEMLRAQYNQEADVFLAQEQRRTSHILIEAGDDEQAALEEANAVRVRLVQGEDFSALAAELSDDPGSAAEGGSLGLIQRGILVGPFEDQLFNMQEGEVSEPVKTDFGYHIIRLDEVLAPQPRPFDLVRDEIREQLRNELIEQRFYNEAQRLNQRTFENPETLLVAAEALDVEIQVQLGVTRLTQSGLAADIMIRDAAFSEKVFANRYNSDVLQIGNNHVVVIRISDHHISKIRPLDEVREDIIDRIRQRQANTMALQLTDQIMERANSGDDLEAMADEHFLPYTPPRTINRTRPGIPFDLADALFSAPAPSTNNTIFGTTPVGANEYVVYQILSSEAGDLGELTLEERETRERLLTRQQSSYAFNAYVEDRKNRVGVTRQKGNLLDQ